MTRDESGSKAQLIEDLRAARERIAALESPAGRVEDIARVFDAMPEPAYAIDPTGRVIAWNHEMERITGALARDMLGRDQYEYAIPFFGVRRPMAADMVVYDDAALRDNFPTVRRAGEILEHEFYAPARGRGGSTFWSLAQPLRDASGTVIGAVECLRDVTRQKLLESALTSAKGELEGMLTELQAALEKSREQYKAEAIRRGDLEGELARTRDEFVDWVDQLERSQKETKILGNMIDHLQACRTMGEAYGVVAHSADQLFPSDSGFLAMFGENRNNMEIVATWGSDPGAASVVFEPDQCWALRRGKIHHVDDPKHHQICQHVAGTPENGYLCMPMNAHGEVLGMLHVRFGHSLRQNREADVQAKQRISTTLAEQFALSLSNLKLREILHEQSVRDQLTGLFNRRYMEETLDRELRRAKRQETPLGVIMLDVDHFKRFNDNFGHETGDILLRELGAFLARSIRGEDIACRYGGEEFILIMPGAPMEILARRGEQIRAGVETKLKVRPPGHDQQNVTISLGAAVYPAHGETPESLVGAADMALYKSKEGGRNRVTLAETRKS